MFTTDRTNLRPRVDAYFGYLLKERGFQLREDLIGFNATALVVFQSPEFWLRFQSDLLAAWVQISADGAEDAYFDLDLVSHLLFKSDLLATIEFTDAHAFLDKNYELIAKLFDATNRVATVRELKELAEIRVRKWYPNAFQ